MGRDGRVARQLGGPAGGVAPLHASVVFGPPHTRGLRLQNCSSRTLHHVTVRVDSDLAAGDDAWHFVFARTWAADTSILPATLMELVRLERARRPRGVLTCRVWCDEMMHEQMRFELPELPDAALRGFGIDLRPHALDLRLQTAAANANATRSDREREAATPGPAHRGA